MSITKGHVKIFTMEKIINYTIDSSENGLTIEEFLRKRGYSKNLIVHLRKTDLGLTIEGKLAYTTHKLKQGEELTVKIKEDGSSENIVPSRLPLDIVYEDEDILVVNKAANMPIHPSQGNYDNTLANAAAYYFAEKGEPFVYRAINRLDRDTTGLLIIAKHMLSAAVLSFMVKERLIHREYMAIAEGRISREGTVTAPIARADGSTIERCVDFEKGDFARTHYWPVHCHETYDCTLLRLHLDTGRTHQIRVHMKYIGHPLLGDFLYNPDYRFIKRQALHSSRLDFAHPVTGKKMSFEAPLPDDMAFIL
ncbi:RluA family pseudouridine synthase [Clostridium sp. MCC353]|uniref:RluA family pseudouridine synthase n=1 Tax=Clostridium sp. MCC353 TaxID=2592646 RepID=UPI0031FEAAFC